MRLVVTILFGLLVVSCGTGRLPTPAVTQTAKDSTVTKIRYIDRDTTYTIPADTAFVSALIDKLGPKPVFSKSKTKKTTARLWREGNTVKAECNTEELELELQYKQEIIEIYRERFEKKDQVIEKVEKYIPKAVKYLMWIGIGFLALIGIGIILKFKKLI